jgi:hypothetical protein
MNVSHQLQNDIQGQLPMDAHAPGDDLGQQSEAGALHQKPGRRRDLSTARVRRHRQRKLLGQVPVQLVLWETEIDDMISLGRLARGHRNDRAAIGAAVGDLLDDALPALLAARPR